MATFRGLNTLATPIKISEDAELVGSHLERLFFTPIGSIPGLDGIGSRIPLFFWEPADESLANDILEEVKLLIDAYEPRLELLEVQVEFINLPNSSQSRTRTGMSIEVTWQLRDDETVQDTTQFFRIKEVAA